ncbi:MAG: DUF1800 domain-containing protein [Steroidobacteraceae bacterium]
MLAQVQASSAAAFIDDQLSRPPSSLGSYSFVDPDSTKVCTGAANPDSCYRDNYTAFPIQRQFFINAVGAPDQLRQRVAFALSQIFVVSGVKIQATYGLADYQQMLMADSFGNVRQLLTDVTLHPVMGQYLDMVDNDKPDPTRSLQPNENYARELLQLFSIGVVKLNADGSLVTDSQAQPVPTYNQDVVEGFAHVLTGWSYPTRPGVTAHFYNPVNLAGKMEPFSDHHDVGPKLLLNGAMLPPGQTPEKDLSDALDNVFQHPNLGPFLGKQLIQHLVTSNPSPAYVARITAVFNDNGGGVRGDLKAIVRAILLDAEARGDVKSDPSYGKLREPALYLAGLLRVFNGRTDGAAPAYLSETLGQPVYVAPSVFNFYPPGYRLAGTAVLSPPSKLQDTASVVNRANFIDALLNGGFPADASVAGGTGTVVDLSPLDALAADPARLMDKLSLMLMHNDISAPTRQIIQQATGSVPADSPRSRVLMASYLLATSSQYQVER